MKRPAKTDLPAPRLSQEAPEAMIARLLGLVRGQFCGDLTDKEWFQHRRFIQAKVLLWPAAFMRGKGFTVTAERYEAIMRAILAEIKTHATGEPIRYWPGYLMKCVQDHWKHHWEEYYQEAKSVRAMAENTLLACRRSGAAEDRGVEALATAQRVLSGLTKIKLATPVRKRVGKEQLTLL